MEKVIKIYDKDNVKNVGVMPLDEISSGALPANITADEDGLYIKRSDGKVYPISHPDLSTQPSILPQRFGNLDIKEMLIFRSGLAEIGYIPYSILPDAITIIEASAFNSKGCYPVIFAKDIPREHRWLIIFDSRSLEYVNKEVWLLIRYVDLNEGGYGYYK